jgi:hypothetical protein
MRCLFAGDASDAVRSPRRAGSPVRVSTRLANPSNWDQARCFGHVINSGARTTRLLTLHRREHRCGSWWISLPMTC